MGQFKNRKKKVFMNFKMYNAFFNSFVIPVIVLSLHSIDTEMGKQINQSHRKVSG